MEMQGVERRGKRRHEADERGPGQDARNLQHHSSRETKRPHMMDVQAVGRNLEQVQISKRRHEAMWQSEEGEGEDDRQSSSSSSAQDHLSQGIKRIRLQPWEMMAGEAQAQPGYASIFEGQRPHLPLALPHLPPREPSDDGTHDWDVDYSSVNLVLRELHNARVIRRKMLENQVQLLQQQLGPHAQNHIGQHQHHHSQHLHYGTDQTGFSQSHEVTDHPDDDHSHFSDYTHFSSNVGYFAGSQSFIP